MTLNITVLTPTVIYQSSDFRLSDLRSGAPERVPSTKSVNLEFEGWRGFLTYAGIGRIRNEHTAQTIKSWMLQSPALTLAEAVELVRRRGTEWLRQVAPGFRHTFVLAAFEDGSPVAAEISNCLRWHGSREREVSADLFVRMMRLQGRAAVIVTGIEKACTRPQRRALQRLAEKYFAEPQRVRVAIAALNRSAARTHSNLISEDCIVQSLDVHGRGHLENFGTSRAIPHLITNGNDLLRGVENLLSERFGKDRWTLVGSTSASANDRSSVAPPCEIRISEAASDRYELVLLDNALGNRAAPRAMNEGGIIVGQASFSWRAQNLPAMWGTTNKITSLEHLGGLGGDAVSVSNDGEIIGSNETPNRILRASRWSPNGQLSDLGAALPSHSAALAVSASGLVVGWSSLDSVDGGQAWHRPCVWESTGDTRVLDDLGGAWGEAVAVNAAGVALLRVHERHSTRAMLWHGENVMKIDPPSAKCEHFYPLALTDRGAIVGLTIRSDGRRGAARRDELGVWAEMTLPAECHVTCANEGVIAGVERVEGLERPWVWPTGERSPILLPYLRNHHTRPTAIGPRCQVLGTATADHCVHPILWRPL